MPSLLLVVFVLQLVIYLVNTLGAQAIDELAWLLYNKLPTPTSAAVHKAQAQRRELVKRKQEMAGVSAQDEFAKWAKLRRQYDKLEAEYQKTAASLSSSKGSFVKTVSTARWLLTSGLRLVLQFWYNKTPMFWLPNNLVPGYVEWALSFPRAPRGSVSMQIWTMACASVIAMVGEAVGAVLGLARTDNSKTNAEPMVADAQAGGPDRKGMS